VKRLETSFQEEFYRQERREKNINKSSPYRIFLRFDPDCREIFSMLKFMSHQLSKVSDVLMVHKDGGFKSQMETLFMEPPVELSIRAICALDEFSEFVEDLSLVRHIRPCNVLLPTGEL